MNYLDEPRKIQKAAILLITLGQEKASKIFKYLKDEEREQLTLEIASIKSVSPKVKEDILNEFYQMCLGQEYISEGGIDYAKNLLEQALGTEKAMEIINKLTANLQVRPFEFARKTEASQLYNFIRHEHPQVIALILCYLKPSQAATIMAELSEDLQSDVSRRIAKMDRASPEIIHEVERELEKRISSLVSEDYASVGGMDAIVDIINQVDRSTEKNIMENMLREDPELAEMIKQRMFVFEDIITLDSRSIQRILRDVDSQKLTIALKGTKDSVREVILENVSKRMRDNILEELEIMGPKRMKEIEEIQQEIVAKIRELEDRGEIVISRGNNDDVVV